MHRVWFVYNHSTVQGPFSREELAHLVRHSAYSDQDLVWKKGHKEWQSLQSWIQEFPSYVNNDEATTNSLIEMQEVWYIIHEGFNQGPFTIAELIENFRTKTFKLSAKVWTDGLKAWIPVYEAHDIIEGLGLSRRTAPRVPVVGKAALVNSTDGFDIRDLDILTVSAGGFGVKAALEPGQLVNVKIESPLLSYPIQAQARVVYKTEHDSGLQFTFVSSEMHAAIIEYVKQFKDLETA